MHLPFVTAVAGVSRRQQAVTRRQEGERVLVRHDPHNPHDSSACPVHGADGALLGYLPASVASRVVTRFGRGVRLTGQITEIVGRRQPTTGLRIRLEALHRGVVLTDLEPDVHEAGALTPAVGDPVVAASGRTLGSYAGRDGGDVLVDTAGGRRRYPEALVAAVGGPGQAHAPSR